MSSQPVGVFLAAPDMAGVVTRLMFPSFQDGARFRVASMAADWDDVQRDVARYRPDVLVLDAMIAPDPETLKAFLAQLVNTAAIVVLPPAWANYQGQFEGIQTSVRGVFIGPPNWAAVANTAYTAVMTERTRMSNAAPAAANYQSAAAPRVGGQTVVGTRVIAFMSHNGGTGKSSIAEAMAVELGRNHVRTLLCSFNSPPAAAGHFKLSIAPNATEWLNRPSVDGFQASLQRARGLDDLDVLMAPSDHYVQHDIAASRQPDAPDSIKSLVLAAYSFNYGAILLDLPPFADSPWTLYPLLAANVAVIVCRPTRHDQIGAIRSHKLITEQFASQIRVPPEAIFMVMNFTSSTGNMSERDFHAAIADQVGGMFPPILTSFPYTPGVPNAQNLGSSPIFESSCDEFARSTRSLVGKLIGGSVAVENNGKKKGLFGISLKMK